MTYRVQASAEAEADIDCIFNCLFEGRKQGCNSYWDASPFRSPEMCMVSWNSRRYGSCPWNS